MIRSEGKAMFFKDLTVVAISSKIKGIPERAALKRFMAICSNCSNVATLFPKWLRNIRKAAFNTLRKMFNNYLLQVTTYYKAINIKNKQIKRNIFCSKINLSILLQLTTNQEGKV